MEKDLAQAALLCKVMGDETRLRIIDMLACGELCACNILDEFAITQPTLSYHMKQLTECGLVVARREGKWTYYSLNREMINGLNTALASVFLCHDGKKQPDFKECE